MYVACPSCKTLFQIQQEHLKAAAGRVRCGACRTTFSAAGAAFDQPGEALAYARQRAVAQDIDELVNRALDQVPRGAEPAHDQAAGEPAAEPIDEAAPELAQEREVQPPAEPAYVPKDTEPEPAPQVWAEAAAAEQRGEDAERAEPSAPRQPEAETPAAEPAVAAVAAAERVALPFAADLDFQAQPLAAEFVSRRQASVAARPVEAAAFLLEDEYSEGVSRSAWGSIAAALLLTALLVGQYGYVERHHLATKPQLRPVLELACGTLGCDLPLQRDVGKVEILEREVRDHPKVDDALLINVSFANQAAFAQPYPVFEVSFSDVSGTAVAARRFQPDEYLRGARMLTKQLQPGEQAQLMLEVLDPGERAVSFQFEFL